MGSAVQRAITGLLAGAVLLGAILLLPPAPSPPAGPPDPVAIERGRYLVHAGGCASCHTADEDGATPFAGGRALETPFGTFWSPNITPDPETGIGRFTPFDVARSLKEGVAPDGSRYYPAFPYPSYAGMTQDDAEAIGAYLLSLEPVKAPRREHELPWYLRSRLVMIGWNLLNFRPLPFVPDTNRDDAWNRGAYLVRHLGHCGECHSPRTFLGAVDDSRELAGNPEGPDGDEAPNLTPDPDDGLDGWSAADFVQFLETGMLPDGDFAGASMGEVIDDNTSALTPEDREAIATYLLSLPPRPSP